MAFEDLKNKLIKNSTIKLTASLDKSKVYGHAKVYPTKVPMINVACSGLLDGGFSAGILLICGNSKHFKSSFTLLLASAFVNTYPDDAIILFYDSEFGTPKSYVNSFDIDPARVIHSPITDIEELKHDITNQIDVIERGEKVIIIVDSIGNLASKKEVDDAISGNSAADMTRAKQLKSVFRMITPKLNLKDIPFIAVNHIYMTQETYSKTVVSGGTGLYLSANDIWIIGRQQDKDAKTKEILGYDFIINIEKSRRVKEKSKIPISVSYDGGIERYSGLLDIALEGGFAFSPKNGYFQLVNKDGEPIGEPLKKSVHQFSGDIWRDFIKDDRFKKYVESKYKFSEGKMFKDEVTTSKN